MPLPIPSHPDALHVAADVHMVAVGEDFVVLEARRDRYLCLPGGSGAMRLSECRRVLLIGDADLRSEFLGSGLVTKLAPATTTPWRPVATPRRSALPEAIERVRLADLPDMAWSLGDLLRGYWRRPFQAIVQAAADAPSGSVTEVDPAALLREAADFQRWAPYAPTSSKCLLRAFMLLRQIQRRGHRAQWVFGVRTWPFEAHCWLQSGDLVLDDDVERVLALEPILVIG